MKHVVTTQWLIILNFFWIGEDKFHPPKFIKKRKEKTNKELEREGHVTKNPKNERQQTKNPKQKILYQKRKLKRPMKSQQQNLGTNLY